METISASDFKCLLSDAAWALVLVGASWSAPSAYVRKEIEEIEQSSHFLPLHFYHLEVEDLNPRHWPEVLTELQGVPTVLLIRGGQTVRLLAGPWSRDVIVEALEGAIEDCKGGP